jgi:hypothetical protein
VYPELYPPVDRFSSSFENLIAGSGQRHALSFLDRKKATWERTNSKKRNMTQPDRDDLADRKLPSKSDFNAIARRSRSGAPRGSSGSRR